ncbi:relaxase/mobilization nuclease domain-containing protein [Botrimarina mediterranea]|uniref:Relaxase/Mobilization nuclease domain protein n=1 Tax=Botrimarina mediterranea TaxID=2528022 RepID=A0A518K2A1_9BACT|nr:relaxase/mobilization nuclease domain-containing protein [Botrimarina mediterranea]QDV71885.1 Relaxase/Mobilization nuclease domain protein [Botrimarina mediterranea]
MNVKIVTKQGRSFAGAAAYLLHDEGRNTSERVAWTDTQGLGTKNPEAAWRVMAATALDAERLKRQAGVPASGRKQAGGPVMHLVLSWAEGEIENLSAEEMRRAAREAVSKLGKDSTSSKKVKNGYRYYGDECQMLMVAHNDKAHPHVHILLNRVHPLHGRMLPDGNDQLKLSKWAQKYQERHGNEHLTPQRTLNNAARERGEYVKGEPPTPRHQHEAMKGVSETQAARKALLLAEQTRRAAAIAKEQRTQNRRGREALEKLQRDVRVRLEAVERSGRESLARVEARRKERTGRGLSEVRDAYRPKWGELYHQLRAELAGFRQNEEKLVGRVTNALRAIDFGALVGGDRQAEDGRVSTFREAFGVLASRGAREAALKTQHERREEVLRREQKAREREVREKETRLAEASRKLRLEQQKRLVSQTRRDYLSEREKTLGEQQKVREATRGRWRGHQEACREEWRRLVKEHPRSQGPAQPTPVRDVVGTGDPARGAALIDSERERRERLRAEIDALLAKEKDGRSGRGDRDGIER